MALDPVCRMEVAESSAELTSEHAGTTYYFCIPACKAAFDREPHLYLGPATGGNPEGFETRQTEE